MWSSIWDSHKGRVSGLIIGFILSMIYLFSGFWDMLIVAFIVYVCYYIGKSSDQNQPSLSLDKIYKWLTERWGMFR